MKGPKRHPHIKRAQRRTRQRAFERLMERGDVEAVLRELDWRMRHLEYADLKGELTVQLTWPSEQS